MQPNCHTEAAFETVIESHLLAKGYLVPGRKQRNILEDNILHIRMALNVLSLFGDSSRI